MLALLVMAMTALFLERLDGARSPAATHRRTAGVLGQAREALIAHAATHRTAGLLPCPDLDLSGDGLADHPCPVADGVPIGWLPWRSLGLPPLRDGSGALLWYAVDPGRATPGATATPLRVRGAGGRIIPAAALVIAPGRVLAGQRRHTDLPVAQRRRNYLESDDPADADGVPFRLAPASSTFNDRLLMIPTLELPTLVRPGDGA